MSQDIDFTECKKMVVGEVGQSQTRAIRPLSAKVRPDAGLNKSKPCKRAGLTMRRRV